jgi:CheY-like chemotaxis protein
MRPRKRILCINDDEQELSVLRIVLETNGYRVIPAASGEQAIGLFPENRIDLVLADYAMPQMDGDQLIERLKQMAPHIPMILLGVDLWPTHADALLLKRACPASELLDRIKVRSARRRGPRQGWKLEAGVRIAPAAAPGYIHGSPSTLA